MDLDYKAEDTEPGVNKYDINAINDMTSVSNTTCANFVNMCCNREIMHQEKILERTRDAYFTEATLGWERVTTQLPTQITEE